MQRSTGRVVAVKGFKLAHTDKKVGGGEIGPPYASHLGRECPLPRAMGVSQLPAMRMKCDAHIAAACQYTSHIFPRWC